ncbi:MAG: TIR domain-containing protein [Fulvivirga sp.]
MSLLSKKKEIQRLIKSFETEADKFHDIEFHTFTHKQGAIDENRKYQKSHHAIILWQYIGDLKSEQSLERFKNNLITSDLKNWGIRGAELSSFGVIEGPATKLFLKMAKRAGSIFSETEIKTFNSRVVDEISKQEQKTNPHSTIATVTNDNPLAIWLNYLLFYISKNNPSTEQAVRIYPDLFTLSLLALEQMAEEHTLNKSDKSNTKLSDINFKVAVSFPGEKRKYVSNVVDHLRPKFEKDQIFYDFDYQAQIARPNADTLLQNIYHKQSDLIVIFLCEEYTEKEWCGLEWRAIRDLIKSKKDEKIMFVKFDNAQIEGIFSTDGYIDANNFNESQVAQFIIDRLDVL